MHAGYRLTTLGSGTLRNLSFYARTTPVGFRAGAQLYIGSTGQTVHRRELARRRKLIQLSRDRIAYYKPALKIWHSQGNFYQGICVVLRQEPQSEPRLALESSLIQVYQSNLNAPRVGTILSKLRLHEKKFAIFGTKAGNRFVRRANRHARHRHVAVAVNQHTIADSTEVCLSLYRL